MLPVALALSGFGLSTVSVGFIGWFGPRASMVLGRVYLEHAVEAVHPTIHLAVMATVLLSILAYGLSAGPAAARYGRHVASLSATAAERGRANLMHPSKTAGRGPAPPSTPRAGDVATNRRRSVR
jgi:hypothetical protein